MDKRQLSKQIGRRLRELRQKQGLTLDQLAARSNVSKPMLSQMERGDSNPSVSTLWKVANGLSVSFSTFLDEGQSKPTLIRREQIQPVEELDEGYCVFPYFAKERFKSFEIYQVELEWGCSYVASPHLEGVEEYIMVTEGCLEVTEEQETYRLEKGDALLFRGDVRHVYTQVGEGQCEAIMVIHYGKS
ncbi:helix-turn-helix domain-containing protein [Shouchella shacheensis]|uniref:helix-turn-helix domain-containing protein n=1 Tax=Shouchella shacheensis TaxID=1649580 RepID=UPI00073FC4B0|nr:XRE family transcriptional regulator [Shouchella shacheensis]